MSDPKDIVRKEHLSTAPIGGQKASHQESIDAFYKKVGPCCAGCDHWRWINTVVGLCMKSKISPSAERTAMLNIQSSSLNIGSGHAMTERSHHCAFFEDKP